MCVWAGNSETVGLHECYKGVAAYPLRLQQYQGARLRVLSDNPTIILIWAAGKPCYTLEVHLI